MPSHCSRSPSPVRRALCHQVEGAFVGSSPATCAAIFCTEGTLSGGVLFDGTGYSFVGYVFAPDGGLVAPGVITETGTAWRTSSRFGTNG